LNTIAKKRVTLRVTREKEKKKPGDGYRKGLESP